MERKKAKYSHVCDDSSWQDAAIAMNKQRERVRISYRSLMDLTECHVVRGEKPPREFLNLRRKAKVWVDRQVLWDFVQAHAELHASKLQRGFELKRIRR